MDHVTVGDLTIAYRRRGRGPALLLVHGAVCDSRVWRVELESFSDEFTVVAWDAPGCGGSSEPPDAFRMAEFADCLAGFIDAAGLERPHVLGHSFGADARARAVPPPSVPGQEPRARRRLRGLGRLPPADEVQRRVGFARAVGRRGRARRVGSDRDARPLLRRDAGRPGRGARGGDVQIRPPATRTMAYTLAEADLRGALADIDTPTLLVHGDADERSPVEVGRALQHRSPARP